MKSTPPHTLSATPNLRIVRDEDPPSYDAPPPSPRAMGFAMIPPAVRAMKKGELTGMYGTLAFYANAKRECWPSIKTLCEDTGWSDRHVRNLLEKLREAGVIEIERRFKDGMRSSHLYRLLEKSPEVQIGTEYRTIGTQCRSDRYVVPVGSVHGADKQEPRELEPRELGETPLPPAPAKPYAEDFETFWPGYPKGRGSKGEAYQVWKRMTADERLAATEALPAFQAGRDWREGFHTAPHIWLGRKRWDNPPEPAAPVGSGYRGGGARAGSLSIEDVIRQGREESL